MRVPIFSLEVWHLRHSPISGADTVDFGLKCAACPFPFPAIKLAAAWFHPWGVYVLLDLGIADVAENLQIVDRVSSALALGYHVVDLE